MMHGKWSWPNIPHRGWKCLDIEDLGEPAEICEMCESQTIRYVHLMAHPAYPGQLRCGCVCAGHMEGDHKRACDREARAKRDGRARLRALENQKKELAQREAQRARDAPVFAQAQEWISTIEAMTTMPLREHERTFVTDVAERLTANFYYVSRLSEKQLNWLHYLSRRYAEQPGSSRIPSVFDRGRRADFQN